MAFILLLSLESDRCMGFYSLGLLLNLEFFEPNKIEQCEPDGQVLCPSLTFPILIDTSNMDTPTDHNRM